MGRDLCLISDLDKDRRKPPLCPTPDPEHRRERHDRLRKSLCDQQHVDGRQRRADQLQLSLAPSALAESGDAGGAIFRRCDRFCARLCSHILTRRRWKTAGSAVGVQQFGFPRQVIFAGN